MQCKEYPKPRNAYRLATRFQKNYQLHSLTLAKAKIKQGFRIVVFWKIIEFNPVSSP